MLTLFLTLLSLSHAQVPQPPAEGAYQVKGEFNYLTTSANYSTGGTSNPLPGNGKLSSMMGLGQVTYDFNNNLRAYLGLSGGQTEAHVINPLTSTITTIYTDTHTNTGLNEAFLGGQWWFTVGDLDIVPQGDFVAPISRVNTDSVDPLLGEGAMVFQGGSWLMYRLKEFTPFAYGGFAYRDGGRSGLFPYHLGVRYGHADMFWVQAEFRGFETVTNDSADRNLRDGYLVRVNGGSYEYYAVNPGRAEVAGMAGLQFGTFGAYIGGSLSVMGRGSADRWTAVAGITLDGFLFGNGKRAKSTQPEGFSEKPEKYDDQLFQQDQSSPLTPIEEPPEPKSRRTPKPVVTPAPDIPAPAPAPRKKPVKREEPMPDVENLMKETEKSLDKKGR